MQAIINFGRVALTEDLIFGLCVYTETGWVPFSEGTLEERKWVAREVLGHPFEQMLKESSRAEVHAALAEPAKA